MFGSQVIQSVVVVLGDPGAARTAVVWRAPAAGEILTAQAVDDVGLVAGTDNYFTVALQNGGTAGTATTAVASAIGGTPGWTQYSPKSFTVSEGTFAAGEYIRVAYDETGACAQHIVVMFDYVLGIGA